MDRIEIDKKISVQTIVGWLVAIIAFAWLSAGELGAIRTRLERNEETLKDSKSLVEKIHKESDSNADDLIRLKIERKSLEQRIDDIKKDIQENKEKLDKIYDLLRRQAP